MTAPEPYNPQIPQAGDTIAKGQTDFLNNFAQLFNAFNADHIPLDAASNAGNHNVIRLVEQAQSPNTQLSEVALYSKDVVNQTDQLFGRLQGNSAEFQYSNYQLFPIPDIMEGGVLRQHSAFSFLPGGVIMYFGFVVPNGNPFNIVLNPVITKNIIGINLGIIGGANVGQYPSNTALLSNPEGQFTTIVLSSNQFFFPVLPPQSYIIYGLI